MKITALLDALNSALAEPFDLSWSRDSLRFLLVFTVIYAVVVIVAVTDQKNTRPGAEHGSAAWGDVFRLNKFYMDRRGPNLLLTQHFHIGIDGYKHRHNTNILIVGGSGAGKTRTYGVPNVLECACSMVITDPKSEILRAISATTIELPFKHNGSTLKYNEETGTYDYYEYGSAHKDAASGAQLTFENVILQNTTFADLGEGYLIYNAIDSGRSGYYITEGKAIEVNWTKSSENAITHYYDAKTGEEIQINTGKTYISLIPSDGWSSLVIK